VASVPVYFDELRTAIDEALARALAHDDVPAIVAGAMQYAVLGGGKRLRPCLTLAAAEQVARAAGRPEGDARRRAMPAACAVEFVHCYSLVHDDLPAMDDDTLRRGRPTTHVVFGDGLAILAGDALLTAAFALLAESEADRPIELVKVLAAAAGAAGMVGGQAIDLTAAGRVPGHAVPAFDAAALADMHARKTGALIRAAAVLGARSAGADDPTVDAIDRYARELGLAFQIIDDVLDVEGSTAALGKTAGKDAAAGKPTFPAIYGLAHSRRLAADCVARATAALEGARLGGPLIDLANWAVGRTS
jgi:geranylgeranyl pyrophosphate synthase